MDNLRLILLALGVAVVAAIWAFEAWRRRRNAAARDDPFADFDSDDIGMDDLPPWQEQASPDEAPALPPGQAQPERTRREEPAVRDLFEDSDEAVVREEPPLGDLPPIVASRGDEDDLVADTMPIVPLEADPERLPASASESESQVDLDEEDVTVPAAQHPAAEPPATQRPSAAQGAAEADDGDREPPPAQAADAGARPQEPAAAGGKVLSLIVMARPGRRFVGHQIRAALESVGLRYGEMEIFHYHDDDEDDTPLFSAVNALKPGTFDLARLDELSTTGVALFMQLPGPSEDARVFELMLDTARHLAERLGGELGDAARRPLSAPRLRDLRASAAGGDPGAMA